MTDVEVVGAMTGAFAAGVNASLTLPQAPSIAATVATSKYLPWALDFMSPPTRALSGLRQRLA